MNRRFFVAVGTKLRPLLRTDFSVSESGRFSGIVTAVLVFVFERSYPAFLSISEVFSSLLFLVCSKWLKSLQLRAWILVQIDRGNTEGHTTEI